jgi:hypothetical protein
MVVYGAGAYKLLHGFEVYFRLFQIISDYFRLFQIISRLFHSEINRIVRATGRRASRGKPKSAKKSMVPLRLAKRKNLEGAPTEIEPRAIRAGRLISRETCEMTKMTATSSRTYRHNSQYYRAREQRQILSI